MTNDQRLLTLLMSRVLPAVPAVLAHLEPFGRLLLVLRRAVVPAFALGARQGDDVSHRLNPVGFRLRALGFGLQALGNAKSLEPKAQSLFDDLRDRSGAH